MAFTVFYEVGMSSQFSFLRLIGIEFYLAIFYWVLLGFTGFYRVSFGLELANFLFLPFDWSLRVCIRYSIFLIAIGIKPLVIYANLERKSNRFWHIFFVLELAIGQRNENMNTIRYYTINFFLKKTSLFQRTQVARPRTDCTTIFTKVVQLVSFPFFSTTKAKKKGGKGQKSSERNRFLVRVWH